MVVVFHDSTSSTSNESAQRDNYVQYGRRLEKLLAELQPATRSS
jgi:hypothetical protein